MIHHIKNSKYLIASISNLQPLNMKRARYFYPALVFIDTLFVLSSSSQLHVLFYLVQLDALSLQFRMILLTLSHHHLAQTQF